MKILNDIHIINRLKNVFQHIDGDAFAIKIEKFNNFNKESHTIIERYGTKADVIDKWMSYPILPYISYKDIRFNVRITDFNLFDLYRILAVNIRNGNAYHIFPTHIFNGDSEYFYNIEVFIKNCKPDLQYEYQNRILFL